MKHIDNIYIINLDKDTKRLQTTLSECKKISKHLKPIRINGIYGKNLKTTDLIDKVSPVYSAIGLKSAIGCAMSHIKAWETLVENNDNSALFLEDDVVIDNNFIKKFNELKIPDDYYIVYLGCTGGCDIKKEYSLEYPIIKLFMGNGYSKKVVKINENIFSPSLPLALHGYILSRKGAEYLLNEVKKDKINSHIDAQILKYIYNVPSYSVSPQLIYQQNVELNTSNNISSNFPILINKFLSGNDKYNVPMNYKINIGLFQIGEYIVNGITFIMIFIGIMLGLTKVPIKYILIGIVVFFLLEINEMNRLDKNIDKLFILNSTVSISLILLFSNAITQLK